MIYFYLEKESWQEQSDLSDWFKVNGSSKTLGIKKWIRRMDIMYIKIFNSAESITLIDNTWLSFAWRKDVERKLQHNYMQHAHNHKTKILRANIVWKWQAMVFPELIVLMNTYCTWKIHQNSFWIVFLAVLDPLVIEVP